MAELIERLADWFESGSVDAPAVWSVVEEHTRQRVRLGLPLGALLREYARLRLCIHAAVSELAPLTAVDRALDLAAVRAADEYTAQREAQRSRYIGMLAHDLRNPLGYVVMACDLMSTAPTAERRRSLLDQIHDATDRMQRMVDEILGFARGHVGETLPLAVGEHDLGEIVRTVIHEMQAIYGHASIACELDGDLRVTCDADRAYQLVENLLRNSIEHGDGATLARVREADDHDSVVLVVRNHGAIERPAGRRGLGLSIVEQIARAHGARVEMSSCDDTTVTVSWPKC